MSEFIENIVIVFVSVLILVFISTVSFVMTPEKKEHFSVITLKTATYTVYDCGDLYIALAIGDDNADKNLSYLREMPKCKKMK